MSIQVILFLDGEEPNANLVRSAIDAVEGAPPSIVATDGAARYTMQHAIRLDALVGDMDSLTQDAMDYYGAQGTKIVSVAEQHSNDFEKALRYIASLGSDVHVTVFGIHGRRTDHVLTNFSVMQRYVNTFERIVAYDETLIHQFITTQKKTIKLELKQGTLVSLTPLPKALGVTTRGLLYSLDNATLEFGVREGLSNRVDSDFGAIVSITSGALLVSYMF